MPTHIVTTDSLPGREITESFGLVFGFGLAKTDVEARQQALETIETNAENLGANGVFGLQLDFTAEVLGGSNTEWWCHATGTAVVHRAPAVGGDL